MRGFVRVRIVCVRVRKTYIDLGWGAETIQFNNETQGTHIVKLFNYDVVAAAIDVAMGILFRTFFFCHCRSFPAMNRSNGGPGVCTLCVQRYRRKVVRPILWILCARFIDRVAVKQIYLHPIHKSLRPGVQQCSMMSKYFSTCQSKYVHLRGLIWQCCSSHGLVYSREQIVHEFPKNANVCFLA